MLIFKNGRLWCPEKSALDHTALAVSGGRISAVGSDTELSALEGPGVRVIDLQGRLLTPGLWDAHIHLYHWSRARKHLQLDGCRSREEVLDRVGRVPSGQEWVIGWQLNCTRWEKPVLPTRHELDEVAPDRPVLLWMSDIHSAVVNTRALEIAGLTAHNPMVAGGVVEVDVSGRPTGILRELAANLVRDHIPEPSWSELRALIKEGVNELNRWGVTSVSDQRIKDLDDGSLVFRALRDLEAHNQLTLRVSCNVAAHNLEQAAALGLSTGVGSDRLRIGHLKVFSDGTLGSKTARMLQPMVGEEQCGLYLTPPEEMEEVFRRAVDLDFAVSVHSIGDESTRTVLDLFEKMRRDKLPDTSVPHRVEHAQLVDDRDVGRFGDLQLTVSAQPGHALDDRFIAEELLGTRASTGYRYADFQRLGVLLSFGSDAPVSSADPRYGLQSAVHRSLAGDTPWYPAQALSFDQTMTAYTTGAARAAGWNSEHSTLKSGSYADLVVWSNGFEHSGNFLEQSVWLTVSGGRIVFQEEAMALER
ncbi:MAG: amidohydrolase [Candidatus Eremiobacteraeota bacterium]|nr:amidohydrolase [Candidatus Eremiobacteraeota bacterium]